MSFFVLKDPINVAIIDEGKATIIGSTIASFANIVSFTIDVFPNSAMQSCRLEASFSWIKKIQITPTTSPVTIPAIIAFDDIFLMYNAET